MSESIKKNTETFQTLIMKIFKSNLNLNYFLTKIKWSKILLNKKYIPNLKVPDIISIILEYKDSFQKKDMMNIWNVFKLLHRNINNLKEDNEISIFLKSKLNEILTLNNQVIEKYAKLQSNPNIKQLENVMLFEIFKIDYFDFLLKPILESEDFSEIKYPLCVKTTYEQLYRHIMKELFIYNRFWSKKEFFFYYKNGIYLNKITLDLNKIFASIYLNIYHFKLRDFILLKVK